MIGLDHQGNGYAVAAAEALLDWLSERGLERVVAHIHPEHEASNAVARRLELRPTGDVVDGELRWERRLEPV